MYVTDTDVLVITESGIGDRGLDDASLAEEFVIHKVPHKIQSSHVRTTRGLVFNIKRNKVGPGTEIVQKVDDNAFYEWGESMRFLSNRARSTNR